MRRRIPALTRTWAALAAVVLIPLGGVSTKPSVASAAAPASLPHVAGGYVGGGARVPAKVVRAGGYGIRSVPESVDLRGYAPPVGDQGQVGACVAWTIGYDIMGYYAKRNGGSGAPYAPMFLYLRNVAPGGAPTAGLYPDSVLANAQAAGVDTQADYWQGTTNWQTPPTAAQIANAANYRLTGWNRLFVGGNQGTAAQTVIQQALAAGSPVALSFPVYRDFMYLRGPVVYNTLSGTSLGGHMVAAFGYDTQGVWLRNSWGTGWGDQGDVKVSWAFITKVVNSAYTVAGIRTPATPGPVTPAVPPAVSGLSIGRGPAGTTVTVSGTALAGATSVRFGDQDATFTSTTSGATTRLVATAPAHATGVVDVTVTTPAGTSAAGPLARFTYLPPPPAVTGLAPATVSTNGGATVTVTGTDLTGVTTVRIGGVTVPARTVTATSLTAVVPARAAGPADVTVTGPSGTSTAGPAARLTYVAPPAPVVSSLAPSVGLTNEVTTVVVTGANFGYATRVTVGNLAVGFIRLSDTSLQLSMGPRAAGTVAVQVTGPGGTSAVTAAGSFTYRVPPLPVIGGLSATTGRANAATPVILTGTHLGGTTRVTIGGAAVAFSRVSATELRFTAPPRAAGPALITVTTPGGTSAPVTFTYAAPVARGR